MTSHEWSVYMMGLFDRGIFSKQICGDNPIFSYELNFLVVQATDMIQV